jgi:hypothetical protein
MSNKQANYTNLDESEESYRKPKENAFPHSPEFRQERKLLQVNPVRPYRNDSPSKSILKNYNDIKPISPLYQNEFRLPQV